MKKLRFLTFSDLRKSGHKNTNSKILLPVPTRVKYKGTKWANFHSPKKLRSDIEKNSGQIQKKTQGLTKKTQVCESKTQVFDLNTKQGQDVKVYKKKAWITSNAEAVRTNVILPDYKYSYMCSV